MRYRLMLAAAVALTMSLLAVALWPAPSVPVASPEAALAMPSEAAPSAPVAPERIAARAAAEPVVERKEAQLPGATVVALKPGDVPPEPEVENPPPQENDPIPPELPQTAQWRLEKTQHITTLLGRDVERLERELEVAEARGDDRRTAQLGTLIQRNRARLQELREELRELGEAAKAESSVE